MPEAQPHLLHSDNEEWRVVIDFPEYEVSSEGRLRRCVAGKHSPAGTVIRLSGERYLGASLMSWGVEYRRNIHVLVCRAFNGESPVGKINALHKDNNKKNNRADNLYWGSQQDNIDDRTRAGNTPKGERHGCCKLTFGDVRNIRRLKGRYSQRKIALAFNVTSTLIYKIHKRDLWK